MSLDSDKKLHLSKAISLPSIIQITILIFGIATVYAQNKADVDQIKKEQKEIKSTIIKKETLEQMFRVRDIQVENVSKQVEQINHKIDENQKLLIQLLQKSS